MRLIGTNILSGIDPTTLNTVVGIVGAVVGIIGIVATILGIASVTTAIKIKNSIKADNGATIYQAHTIQQTIVNEKTNKEEMRALLEDDIRSIVKEEIQRESVFALYEDTDKTDTSLATAPLRPKTASPDSLEGNDEKTPCTNRRNR